MRSSRRERMALSKGARSLLRGRGGEDLETLETEGQMLQRVLPGLMGMKNIVVFNDEAHHCYREKPGDPDEVKPKGDDLSEAKANKEAARVWISGLESVQRRLGRSGHRESAVLHLGLQQHDDLEAALRLHLRLRAAA